MLKAFTLQNFQSFREVARVSLELNRNVPEDGRSCKSELGTRLSKVIAVLGANASGKTTLIKGLAFVDWFVKHSFHAKPSDVIPLEPHFSATDEPSHFELEFEYNGRDWRYRLVASKNRVLHESLYSRHGRAFSYVFVRDWGAKEQRYRVKQQQFGMAQKEAEKVRENASLISTAAQYDVDLASQLVSTNVWSNVHALGRQLMDQDQILRAADFYAKNSSIRDQMVSLLSQWDLGLSDVRVEKHRVTRENGEAEDIHIPIGIHRVGETEYPLMFLHQSSGTQGAFILLSRILPALYRGGLVLIDELEADLHPHMLIPILDLFFSSKTNPHNAQIIFTCHSLEILSLLHKAQVVLVEKNADCQSDAWRLDSVKGVRADDNLYAKYMAGAYGAIPQL